MAPVWPPLEEGMQFTPVFLPGKPHGQRSLGGYSPCGHKELDTSERLSLLLLLLPRSKDSTMTSEAKISAEGD